MLNIKIYNLLGTKLSRQGKNNTHYNEIDLPIITGEIPILSYFLFNCLSYLAVYLLELSRSMNGIL